MSRGKAKSMFDELLLPGSDSTEKLVLPKAAKTAFLFSDIVKAAPCTYVDTPVLNMGPFKWSMRLYPNGETETIGEKGNPVVLYIRHLGGGFMPATIAVDILDRRNVSVNHRELDYGKKGVVEQVDGAGIRTTYQRDWFYQPSRMAGKDGVCFHLTITVRKEAQIMEQIDYSSHGTLPTEVTNRPYFPSFYSSGFSSLVIAGDTPPASQGKYISIKASLRSLLNPPGFHPERDASNVKTLLSSSEASSSSAPSSSESRQEDNLYIHYPALFINISPVELEKLPSKSVLGYLVYTLGGALQVSHLASNEELIMLCHVIHLHEVQGVGCLNLILELRNALFRLHRQDVNFNLLIYVIWTECQQSIPLLNLIGRFLRPDPIATLAALDRISHLSHLNPSLFESYSASIRDRIMLSHQWPFTNATLSDLIPKGIDSSYATFTIQSSLKPESLNIVPEILYARWPYFKRMIDANLVESRTSKATLPLTRSAIYAISNSVATNGKWVASLYKKMVLEDVLSILSCGQELGFYSSLSDLQPNNTFKLLGGVSLFINLLQECCSIAFPSDDIITEVFSSYHLNWNSRLENSLDRLAGRFESSFFAAHHKIDVMSWPQELQLSVFKKIVQRTPVTPRTPKSGKSPAKSPIKRG